MDPHLPKKMDPLIKLYTLFAFLHKRGKKGFKLLMVRYPMVLKQKVGMYSQSRQVYNGSEMRGFALITGIRSCDVKLNQVEHL